LPLTLSVVLCHTLAQAPPILGGGDASAELPIVFGLDRLFTVVSLVIAVAGAAYTAMIAWRTIARGQIEQYEKEAAEFVEEIRDSKSETTKTSGERHYKSLRRWHYVWDTALAAPVTVFSLSAFGIAAYVGFGDWRNLACGPEGLANYRLILLGNTAVSFLGVVCTLISYLGMRSAFKEIQAWKSRADEDAINKIQPPPARPEEGPSPVL